MSDGAWLNERSYKDKEIKAYLGKWRSRYNPAFLEIKIAIENGKMNGMPNIGGALKVLAELADKHDLALSWNLRKKGVK